MSPGRAATSAVGCEVPAVWPLVRWDLLNRDGVRSRGIGANVIGRNAQNMDFAVTAPLKTVEGSDIAVLMEDIGRQAKSAARALALAPTAQKNEALAAMATAIRASRSAILAANAQDLAEAKTAGTTSAFLDRLALDDKRVAAMADGL